MQSIRQIERLNQTELDKCVPSNASWHTDYRDTAYVYIGGLPFELSEGDILTIFSQYGNPVHINLVRDKDTGKSKGFCFLKYEDQRSCDLAVDNLSGAGVMGRVMSVDHTRYKKKEGEVEGIMDEEEAQEDTDKEDGDRRKRRKTESESEEERPLIKEEIELQKLLRDHDDDDPMKEYLVKEKREEIAEALKSVVKHKSKDQDRGERKHRHRHHHRSRKRDDEEGGKEHRSRRRRDEHEGEPHRSRRGDKDEEDIGKHRLHRARRERSRSPGSDDCRRSERKPRKISGGSDPRRDRNGRYDSRIDGVEAVARSYVK
ncbi:U2 snRNP component ist3 [Fulvia fulva]|uniref:U2 snRNP component ist3 n=1 Tax=Passalora fulva TaxID=5499 RepID=A0A9Q8P3K0_PASFU|nr:U2 snRNP component ist3 [Fulvia fulva]KAK4635861.1 U2 snRNP component ist3 [Fulvia fulva]KAK4637094.1 U2 snRNP component ist3 [Fulvia fulva]UJO11777.1 U2 snRNP component ist3 [Fulvia fulva]WPV09096.1 U2 snRNP component ist3 [Fulvia fulva]WPV23928.1 U2 snRNP component ist3 [Fulvia fulva]